MAAQRRLVSELTDLEKEKWVHLMVDEGNILNWKLGLMVVNPDSVFYGAFFKAEMRFPSDYPHQPPTFRFLNREILHPNIYSNGHICISILHKPGEDEQSGEQACERWSPLQGVESVLRSVLLLLDDPEISSPANVDASVMYRQQREQYNQHAHRAVESSKKDMPPGVRFPTQTDLEPKPQNSLDDDDFWNESDGDVDFDSSSEADFDMDEEGNDAMEGDD